VRRERLARGLTQEELAEGAELAVRSLQKIEAGRINILITTARRLRRALGCSWECLLDQ
jgi:transcriptional regulator with XRE-family HTH domain